MKTNTTVVAMALLVSSLATPHLYAQAPMDNQKPDFAAAHGPDHGRPDHLGTPADSRDYGRPGNQKFHAWRGLAGPGKHQGPGRDRGDRRPGGGPAGRGGGGPAGRGGGGPAGRGGLTSLTTVSGTVGQWIGNDDMILDGFSLTGGSSTSVTTVKFPAHLGQQVQKAVKPGSSVSVTGYTETGRGRESHFRLTSLTAGKTTVFDTPAARPAPATDTPTMVTETGKIADYKLDRGGRVNGLVLDNKTVVQVPPHVVAQLTNLATKGTAITVQGYPRTLREGQVQLEKANILRASVLTINGQQYLVR